MAGVVYSMLSKLLISLVSLAGLWAASMQPKEEKKNTSLRHRTVPGQSSNSYSTDEYSMPEFPQIPGTSRPSTPQPHHGRAQAFPSPQQAVEVEPPILTMVPVVDNSPNYSRTYYHDPNLSQSFYQMTNNAMASFYENVWPMAMRALTLAPRPSSGSKEQLTSKGGGGGGGEGDGKSPIQLTDEVYPRKGPIPTCNQLGDQLQEFMMQALFDQHPIMHMLKRKQIEELLRMSCLSIEGTKANRIQAQPHPVAHVYIHPEYHGCLEFLVSLMAKSWSFTIS